MNAMKQALYSRLAGGTALTALLAGTTAVYDTLAPQGAALPYVVFSQYASNVENLDANDRESVYVLVKGITTANFAAGGNIADQVDLLLHDNPLAISGCTVLWQKRDQRIEYIESGTTGVFYHVGAIYQIWLTK